MRRPIYAMERERAMALLRRAPVVHMASTRPDGVSVMRTLHGVIHNNYLAFHGGPVGEKVSTIGREAVFSVEEIVAEIPSTFVDPVRACPATTYYESVQVHGVLEEVTEPAEKAAILQALMERYQPEGGYQRIDAEDPLYRKAVQSLVVVRVSLERLVGKSKLGQNRKPAKMKHIVEQLWERGSEQDLNAIPRILEVNPETPCPAFLAAPEGVELRYWVNQEEATLAAEMLVDGYWNEGLTQEVIATSIQHSTAVVAAFNTETGTLIGLCRATSDRSKHAWVYDVMLSPVWRGCGVGYAMMRLLLEHPALRNVRYVHLQTKDAQTFYQAFGFQDVRDLPPRSYASHRMILIQDHNPSA